MAPSGMGSVSKTHFPEWLCAHRHQAPDDTTDLGTTETANHGAGAAHPQGALEPEHALAACDLPESGLARREDHELCPREVEVCQFFGGHDAVGTDRGAPLVGPSGAVGAGEHDPRKD